MVYRILLLTVKPQHELAMGIHISDFSDFSFLAPKSLQMVIAAMKLKMLTPWKESCDQPRQHIKKQRHYFANKIRLVKAIFFPVVMYGCESWTIRKAEY